MSQWIKDPENSDKLKQALIASFMDKIKKHKKDGKQRKLDDSDASENSDDSNSGADGSDVAKSSSEESSDSDDKRHNAKTNTRKCEEEVILRGVGQEAEREEGEEAEVRQEKRRQCQVILSPNCSRHHKY